MIQTNNLDKINIQKKIINILTTKELDDKLHKNKLITYILIGVFIVIGIILILAGAFFQSNDKKHILIILDSIGATLILVGVFCSFIAPITNFNLLKKTWIQIVLNNQDKYINLISLFLNQVENININNIKIDNKFLVFCFDYNNQNYEIINCENNLFLKTKQDNNNLINLNSNVFNYWIDIKRKLANNFSQINIETFSTIIDINIKTKVINIINELNNKIKEI